MRRIALKAAPALMAILVDGTTRLLVQGLTGSEGRFHGLRNRAYGTNVVAGVTPGKAGEDVEGIPVFGTVVDAVAETKADTALVFVPARFAADAVFEAVDAGIGTVICITEHIPVHDTLKLRAYVRSHGARMIGPNCPGALSPGKANAGIIPAEVFAAGPVGLVSRSGTLTYQIGYELAQLGVGNSTIVGIGGDPVIGSTFVDILDLFEADPETELVVLVGRDRRRRGREGRAPHRRPATKPVIAYIAGFSAPPGKTMGHAGAIISGSLGHRPGEERGARGGRDRRRHHADRGRRPRRGAVRPGRRRPQSLDSGRWNRSRSPAACPHRSACPKRSSPTAPAWCSAATARRSSPTARVPATRRSAS